MCRRGVESYAHVVLVLLRDRVAITKFLVVLAESTRPRWRSEQTVHRNVSNQPPPPLQVPLSVCSAVLSHRSIHVHRLVIPLSSVCLSASVASSLERVALQFAIRVVYAAHSSSNRATSTLASSCPCALSSTQRSSARWARSATSMHGDGGAASSRPSGPAEREARSRPVQAHPFRQSQAAKSCPDGADGGHHQCASARDVRRLWCRRLHERDDNRSNPSGRGPCIHGFGTLGSR